MATALTSIRAGKKPPSTERDLARRVRSLEPRLDSIDRSLTNAQTGIANLQDDVLLLETSLRELAERLRRPRPVRRPAKED